MHTPSGTKLRLDPNTYVRFHQHDGNTPWIRAAELRVNDQAIGVRLRLPDHGVEDRVLPWEKIRRVDVTNQSGGKTAAMFLFTAGGVSLVASMVLFDLCIAGLTNGRARSSAALRISGALLDAAVAFAWSDAFVDRPARPDRQILLDTLDLADPARMPPLRPLFSPFLRRRAIVRMSVSANGGTDLLRWREQSGNTGITLGLRFWDMFELGGGVRYLLAPATTAAEAQGLSESGIMGSMPAPDISRWERSSLLGFFRFILHMDLDARRRVALLLGSDIGGGGVVTTYWRINWGLRVRVTDTFYLGAFLFTPTLTSYRRFSPRDLASGWSFPSGLEAGWAF